MRDRLLDWTRAHADRLVWPAVALGLVLRVQGLGWDAWGQFHPDERNLVAGAARLTFPAAMIPDFHAYNGLALALPKLLAWLTNGPSPDQQAITWAARLLSALASTAAICAGLAIARRLGGPVAAVLAAGMLALSAPLIQWAHFGTTESALVLGALLIWLVSLRLVEGSLPLWRAAMLTGVVLGLSLGVKTTAALYAVAPLAAAALVWRRHGARLLSAGAAAIVLAGAIFVLTTPGLLFATKAYLASAAFEAGVVSGRHDVFWTWQFAGTTDGIFELRQLWDLLEGGGLVLAAAGIAVAVRSRPTAAAPALVLLVAYCGLIVGWQAKFVRYLAPVVPLLLVFAALGGARLLERVRSEALAVTTLAALAVFAASGVTLALSFQAQDPRLAAADHLRDRLAPGEVVLLEPAEVGPQDFRPNETRFLPLIDPAGPEKTAALADAVASGRWVVLYSRRHRDVLPRLPGRFPAACAYYAALFDGRLGFEKVAGFSRARFLGGLFRSGATAEETSVVFDRPEVLLFEKRGQRSREEIRAILDAPGPACGKSGAH